ncbi:membrane protein insertase, YidC/Oxa1 family [Paenibacillus curdlanolyticus YK9]|uniref:Membrane protein insertase YidC n=1 Tax=Paenibacillus curdlanolyticus YK9 TaxID=717606 RepID=E0I3Q3_9BACL|nr:membrane protein insertase YidC [Paenibacillus curdlanolyticus]EFM12917.1 membrane protein insertase, YidC/Oxa1 family [Paenibacillus curdlanolyticus YK9]
MGNTKSVSSRFTALRIYGFLLLIVALMLVSGCSAKGTIDSSTPGTFNHYIVYPFSAVIQHVATWFDGSYGLSIIVITLLVRLILMPLMIRQQTGQLAMRAKMKTLTPELNAVKEKYKSKKDAESQRKLQQETMQLYQQHGVNPLAIGCLPLLIQLPILTGLYYAIRMTPELKTHAFLWFKLGSADPIMPFIAAGVYLIQSFVSQRLSGSDASQQKQMAMLMYLSPIMMGLFSFTAPAALPLYWAVGGVFMIGQSWLAYRLYHRRTGKLTEQSAASPISAE